MWGLVLCIFGWHEDGHWWGSGRGKLSFRGEASPWVYLGGELKFELGPATHTTSVELQGIIGRQGRGNGRRNRGGKRRAIRV